MLRDALSGEMGQQGRACRYLRLVSKNGCLYKAWRTQGTLLVIWFEPCIEVGAVNNVLETMHSLHPQLKHCPASAQLSRSEGSDDGSEICSHWRRLKPCHFYWHRGYVLQSYKFVNWTTDYQKPLYRSTGSSQNRHIPSSLRLRTQPWPMIWKTFPNM